MNANGLVLNAGHAGPSTLLVAPSAAAYFGVRAEIDAEWILSGECG